MSHVRLVFALHNHQPIGNFESVFEACHRDAYAPFLALADEYTELSFALHTSGPLMEWLVANKPEYVQKLGDLCTQGRVEILGGAYHEPILPNIPGRDRLGQVRAYRVYLEELFGQKVRGLWLPERVWEQSLVSPLVEAGMEYTVLDDFHFQQAGLSEQDLRGYYLTEDEGCLLKVFPNSEPLRYLTPWQEPHAAYEYLKQVAETTPGTVVVCADDGEKFGAWPETHEHVYTHGWLRRFFDMLRANRDWITTTTFARAVDGTLPRGKVFLPDASYREMTEWALSPERFAAYRRALEVVNAAADAKRLRGFVRPGASWRNFRARYPESDEMYARMIGVSARLARLEASPASARAALDAARDRLYRSQCNCSYWHGAFGGLYLPHLRNAVYGHLIAAENLLQQAEGPVGPRVSVEVGDFNLDALQEVRLDNDKLCAWIRPAHGGQIYELDDRRTCVNVLATLERRPEAYHAAIAKTERGSSVGAPASATQQMLFKHANLEAKLIYDRHARKALVDHVYPPETTLDDMMRGNDVERGDFASGTYLGWVERGEEFAAVCMEREGWANGHRIRVRKAISTVSGSSELLVRYQLSQLPAQCTWLWAVETNVASMAGDAPDRYFLDEHGNSLGVLRRPIALAECGGISLCDAWRDLSVALNWSKAAGLWCHPIETVSQSEGGFEAVYQSTSVVPYWQVVPDAQGCWDVEIRLCLTSASGAAPQSRRRTLAVVER